MEHRKTTRGSGLSAVGLEIGVATLLLLVLSAVGFFWVTQPVSNQELLANYAKAQDFLSAAKSTGGLPWWTPMFMQGTSLAVSWSFMVTNIVLLVFSLPFGFLVGPKVSVIAMMFFGAWGMVLFLKTLTGDRLCGFIGGVLFLLCPSLLTRAVVYEHFAVLCAMALLPWTFLSIRLFFHSPGIQTAILSAVTFSTLVLAYGKTGIMALPVIVLYAASEILSLPAERTPKPRDFGWAVAGFCFLAVLPNLPALREIGFMAFFEFGPFAGWQQAFSTKSAIGWVDRDGWLTSGIDSVYAPTTANGGTYLGFGLMALFAFSFFRGTLHSSAKGRTARLFLMFGLMMFWLSFGPKGVLGGHFFFLSLSTKAPDFSPALAWFFLAVQVWMIFRLVPPEWPLRSFVATLVSLIYLIVPGFVILQRVPFFQNIRAPFDFFHVTGVVCVVVAAAILARLALASARAGAVRSAMTTGIVCLMVLDVAPYAKPFFQASMSKDVFQNFLDVQERLKSSPIAGRVYAFSGRYFYLLTPYLSGRGLVAEAFNSYLQQRGAAILQGSAFLSDESLVAFFAIGGVSHVLIDKTDPDTPKELQDRMRHLLPVEFENDHFLVLKNVKSLGAGFFAEQFIQAADSQPQSGPAVFSGARYNLATIEIFGSPSAEPSLRGRIAEGAILPIKSGEPIIAGSAFQPVPPTDGGTYQTVHFGPPGKPGWLVMTQAWHPDWRAFQNGKQLHVYRAFLAFPAVRTNGTDSVSFCFEQPWWYNFSIGVAIAAWILALGFLFVSAFLPNRIFSRGDS